MQGGKIKRCSSLSTNDEETRRVLYKCQKVSTNDEETRRVLYKCQKVSGCFVSNNVQGYNLQGFLPIIINLE